MPAQGVRGRTAAFDADRIQEAPPAGSARLGKRFWQHCRGRENAPETTISGRVGYRVVLGPGAFRRPLERDQTSARWKNDDHDLCPRELPLIRRAGTDEPNRSWSMLCRKWTENID